jgi:hypothetical protein
MWPSIKKLLIKSGVVSFLVGIWLIFFPADYAHAVDEVISQVSNSDSSTIVIVVNPTVVIEAAQTAITQAESATALIETQAAAITSPTETITATITQAQTSIVQAQAVVDSATVAVAQVDSATVLVSQAEQEVAIAQISVDSQTATVSLGQTILDSATATVNANTTPGLTMTVYHNPGTGNAPTMGGNLVYTGTDTNGITEQWGGSGPTVNGTPTTITETFNNNTLNTPIGITVNGTPVSTTNNNQVYIGSIGFPGPGQDPSLTLRGSTADTLITMPANTTAASFQVFAKNGTHDAIVTYTDGTTSTFNIQDNVNSTYPNYVHQEVITAPAGKTIATINIPANWDYYGIDNVSATIPSITTVTEDFQVRWQGLWTPQYTGTQYITASADDGVKLYLDGELVINDWFDKGGGGSTADVQTTAGVSKTFDMWYYENGGGAAVHLLRYSDNLGWAVIPGSEFSTSTASPQQLQALVTAQNNLNIAQGALDILEADLTTAEEDLIQAEEDLQDAQDELDSLILELGTAIDEMNNSVNLASTTVIQTLVNEEAERAAAEQARLAAIAAENARVAAAQAYAAEQSRIKAEADAKAAAEAAAKAEADRIAAEAEAAQAEADRIAAEEAAAQAQAEAEAKAEAEAIAEAERLEAEAEAARQAEADAKAEAEAKAAEAEAAKQAEEDAKAEAEKLKAEEEAAKAEQEKLDKLAEDAKEGKELSKEEKEIVVDALIEDLKPGESLSASEIKAAGVSYADLPPSTPVALRTSENGEVLVISAAVAANVELVQDPGALLNAALTDPGAALAALGSIGADMTESEREEATDMVVATVVAAGAAINAAAVATGGTSSGSTGGGGSSGGGGSGANSPGSRGGRKW